MARNIITPRSASSPMAGWGGCRRYIWLAHHIQYRVAITRMRKKDWFDFSAADFPCFTLWMYTNPPMRQVQRSPTMTTASGLIGARPFHQPVLRIQVYILEWPFSSNKWSRKKWDSEPAEISKKHCLLFSGTCNNTKIKQIRHTTLDWYGGFSSGAHEPFLQQRIRIMWHC